MISSLLSVSPALSATRWNPEELVTLGVRPPAGLFVLYFVYRFVQRTPWPRPFRLSFAFKHLAMAVLSAGTWLLLSRAIEAVIPIPRVEEPRFDDQFFMVGMIAYFIAAGISYAVVSEARAARAEALAARSQLAALRGQLHPHFLFNALHTVVQLIPVNQALAMEAAELVADLLRSALEEQRDEVSLAEEWRFVSRYLAMERMRFGDRLVVRDDIPDALRAERVPAFALQTLVENAVRHGAAPRADATTISVAAARRGNTLVLSVTNDGASRAVTGSTVGTGLARLRERLNALYGSVASLSTNALTSGGYEASIELPAGRVA